jgi:tRNA threonylcarbamoyladenosine biosynthesis protein TsaB
VTRLLALETSGRAGSVAVLDGTKLLAERTLDPARGSAATLAPAIRGLLADVQWRPADVQVVAVAVGPGSFTGLRIGVMTAKTLAYALGADIVAVDTLDVIALQTPSITALQSTSDARPLWAVIDAGRDELFAARYLSNSQSGELITERPTALVRIDDWLAELQAGDWVSGPLPTRLEPMLPRGVQLVELPLRLPQARTVGRLAVARHAAGVRDNLWELSPKYHRLSAAEERRT